MNFVSSSAQGTFKFPLRSSSFSNGGIKRGMHADRIYLLWYWRSGLPTPSGSNMARRDAAYSASPSTNVASSDHQPTTNNIHHYGNAVKLILSSTPYLLYGLLFHTWIHEVKICVRSASQSTLHVQSRTSSSWLNLQALEFIPSHVIETTNHLSI